MHSRNGLQTRCIEFYTVLEVHFLVFPMLLTTFVMGNCARLSLRTARAMILRPNMHSRNGLQTRCIVFYKLLKVQFLVSPMFFTRCVMGNCARLSLRSARAMILQPNLHSRNGARWTCARGLAICERHFLQSLGGLFKMSMGETFKMAFLCSSLEAIRYWSPGVNRSPLLPWCCP